MTANSEALKPCPFGCSGELTVAPPNLPRDVVHDSIDCPAHGVHRIVAWNTRYTHPRTDSASWPGTGWPKMGGGEAIWRASAIDRAPDGLYYIFEGVIGRMMPGGPESLTDDRIAWIKNGRERAAIGPLGLNFWIVHTAMGGTF